MKLLDTNGGNTKLRKNNKDINIRVAGLSLYPIDTRICAFQDIAQCKGPCLSDSGFAKVYESVNQARMAKTDLYLNERKKFIELLRYELTNFERLCLKQSVTPYVRLNVISDIQYELKANGCIPQSFPNINFFDYTKIAKRLGKTPDNYELMFSYSNAPAYQQSVRKALKTDVPISVVFFGNMPNRFMGKEVVDGDSSDIVNLGYKNKIVGLKYKSVGDKIDPRDSMFIVNMESA
tara:strand:+ start:671 stop:1375 length:705 start_codon:yes stop_codon:yes gene_type:complete